MVKAGLLSVVLLAGCQGEIVTAVHVPAPTAASEPAEPWVVRKLTCGTTVQTPAGLPLRRLTRTQYTNVVKAVVHASGLKAADQADTLALVATMLARYPSDAIVGVKGEPKGGFERLDQSIQQEQIEVSYAVANGLRHALTASPTVMASLLGACASDASAANDASCLNDFINRFGLLALRRPPSAEDVSFYAAAAGPTPVDPLAVADVIALMLTAPQFLYVDEPGDESTGPVALDAYALASRLSLHFWNSMPDAELFEAARSKALLTPQGLRAQAVRLFNDPRAEQGIREFFAQWFRLQDLKPLNGLVGTPVFDAFAGADAPSATLNEEMKDEIGDLVLWVARSGGSIRDVLTNR